VRFYGSANEYLSKFEDSSLGQTMKCEVWLFVIDEACLAGNTMNEAGFCIGFHQSKHKVRIYFQEMSSSETKENKDGDYERGVAYLKDLALSCNTERVKIIENVGNFLNSL